MTPLLFAAMGGLFTELSGMLNIALEGMLLIGAFASVIVAHFTGSIFLGVLAGITASVALAAITGSITLRLKANVFITGLAANLFSAGLTVALSFTWFGTKGVLVLNQVPQINTLTIPGIHSIPVLGELLSGNTFFVYLSWLLLLLSWFVLYKTPFGFRLRSCEKQSEALASLGMNANNYRFAAFLISGFTCGIGGSMLTLNLAAFVPNISSGKGWIALVVIFLGGRKPLGLLLGAFIFGFAEAFSNYAQGAFNVPADFILAIPYLFTLVVMVGAAVYQKRRAV
jgi:simple sugar transport system permease protein